MEGTLYIRTMAKEQDQATRAARRADEYLRKIQLESMAVAFAVVLVALQVATVLDAAGVVALHQLSRLILIGGVTLWLGLADLRTRPHR